MEEKARVLSLCSSCFEASLVLLIVTAQWMLIALIFSWLSWPLHSPLWSIKHASSGQPPIQHTYFPSTSLSPLPFSQCFEDAVMVLLSRSVPFMVLGVQ